MGTAAMPQPGKKPVARVALMELDEATESALRECFRQFGIETVSVKEQPAHRLQREKFEAMVLRLDANAAGILEAARGSRSNRRIVVYGISGNARETLRFSAYGVNAIFHEPVERLAALKVVHATHLLVLHELRCYVRVPLVMEVSLQNGKSLLTVNSQEISGGGMSLENEPTLPVNQTVKVSFQLPKSSRVELQAAVCWERPNEKLFGIRFEPSEGRDVVRQWIADYLDIS
jgi:hypothetical protein